MPCHRTATYSSQILSIPARRRCAESGASPGKVGGADQEWFGAGRPTGLRLDRVRVQYYPRIYSTSTTTLTLHLSRLGVVVAVEYSNSIVQYSTVQYSTVQYSTVHSVQGFTARRLLPGRPGNATHSPTLSVNCD